MGNDFTGHDYATYPDFLTRLEQIDPAFNTFAALDWPPLGTHASGGPMISDAIDVKHTINGDSLGYRTADSLAVAATVAYLTREDPDAAFVYLGNTDVIGHETSSLDPAYRAEIEWADTQVGALIAALKRRATYAAEDWLILMSTDHGRRDDGGHGGPSPQEQRIFYLASGPSAVQGTPATPPRIVDVAVTALAHLGVTIDPAWNLDGQVVGLSAIRP
jgi:predicted AlkP superfamily pyrophosphatase or phosphodiesterase